LIEAITGHGNPSIPQRCLYTHHQGIIRSRRRTGMCPERRARRHHFRSTTSIHRQNNWCRLFCL